VRGVGPCDDGTTCLFRLASTNEGTKLACDCNGS